MEKNQRLVEAVKVLKDKKKKAYRSICSIPNSAHFVTWSAYYSAYCSTFDSAYCSADSSYDSATWSAKLDKPKVLEIIKSRLK